MALGHDGRLFILAFDHRGSFKKKMFGISGREATDAELARLTDAKHLVWEGVLAALEAGVPRESVGVLVDVQNTLVINAFLRWADRLLSR